MQKKLKLKNKGSQKSVFSNIDFKKGELILEFEQNFVSKATNKVLRISANKYQLSTDPTKFENFINHSCSPNSYVKYDDLSLHALRNIKKDEEICYNYLTSDWDNEDVFDCECGSKDCFKRINGFKNLSIKNKLKLRKYLSPFLEQKLKEELLRINQKR